MKQLNSLISTLKSKLKRGRDDDDDEYEDEEDIGEETEVSEVRTKKSKKSKPVDDEDEDEEGDEEEEDDDDAEAKKKKRVRIMAIVVGALLIWIALDELVLKTPEGDQAVVTEQSGGFKRPPKRVRKKNVDEEKGEATATEAPAASVTEVAPIDAPPIEEVAVVEPVSEPVVEPAVQAEPVSTPEETVAETPAIVEENESENPFLDSPEPSVGETVTELEVQTGQETPGPSSDSEEMKDLVASEIKKEYVEPPKYDQIGRGLVYNCGGKHWACVDKVAYFQCKDNYLHNSTEKKTIECYPSEVYGTYDDCKTVQIHHINMVKEIDFCGGGE